jgi:hypothetical protein
MSGRYRYSETNVMHFSFRLLRIKGLYICQALLSHPQEALYSGTWYIVCVLRQLAARNTHAIYQVLLVKHLLRMSK